MHRVSDVLHGLLASVCKGEGHLIAYMLVGSTGDADAARFCKTFQSCRYIHAITKDVAVVDNDVTDIDPYAELDRLVLRHIGTALTHSALDIECTAHRVHDAAELGEQPVSGIFDDTSTVLSNLGINEGAQVILKLNVRSLLVEADQAAVTSHIGCQDGR
jgi:hypothetical protein